MGRRATFSLSIFPKPEPVPVLVKRPNASRSWSLKARAESQLSWAKTFDS